MILAAPLTDVSLPERMLKPMTSPSPHDVESHAARSPRAATAHVARPPEGGRIRVYDGFIFFNELDLLEIRLHELAASVDFFVIVEARQTFTGMPKPLIFDENRARFSAFADRIIHIIADEALALPPGASAWDRETAQRNAILRGFAAARPEDLVMFSDLDEIPSGAQMARIRAGVEAGTERGDLFVFMQSSHVFRMNWLSEKIWPGPRLLSAALLARIGKSIDDLRQALKPLHKHYRWLPHPISTALWAVRLRAKTGLWLWATEVRDGGWHFTSIGSPERIRVKIGAFSHTELNIEEIVGEGRLESRIACATDLHGKALRAQPLTPGAYPSYLMTNIERFGHLIDTAAAQTSSRNGRKA